MTCYCHRCGEEITAPKFHNGYAYGYSCYEIVSGKRARSSDKTKYVEVELITPISNDIRRYDPLRVKYNDKTYNLGVVIKSANLNIFYGNRIVITEDGKVFMKTHDVKGQPFFKSIP